MLIRSFTFVLLSRAMFQMLSPGVGTVFLPAVAFAPTCPWINVALGFCATYPTMFALPPEQALIAATTLLAPAPSMHTKFTPLPVNPPPLGLKTCDRPRCRHWRWSLHPTVRSRADPSALGRSR